MNPRRRRIRRHARRVRRIITNNAREIFEVHGWLMIRGVPPMTDAQIAEAYAKKWGWR
jgi:hypothetical protein